LEGRHRKGTSGRISNSTFISEDARKKPKNRLGGKKEVGRGNGLGTGTKKRSAVLIAYLKRLAFGKKKGHNGGGWEDAVLKEQKKDAGGAPGVGPPTRGLGKKKNWGGGGGHIRRKWVPCGIRNSKSRNHRKQGKVRGGGGKEASQRTA